MDWPRGTRCVFFNIICDSIHFFKYLFAKLFLSVHVYIIIIAQYDDISDNLVKKIILQVLCIGLNEPFTLCQTIVCHKKSRYMEEK